MLCLPLQLPADEIWFNRDCLKPSHFRPDWQGEETTDQALWWTYRGSKGSSRWIYNPCGDPASKEERVGPCSAFLCGYKFSFWHHFHNIFRIVMSFSLLKLCTHTLLIKSLMVNKIFFLCFWKPFFDLMVIKTVLVIK